MNTATGNYPPPLELPDAGHIVQEWGEVVAREARPHYGLAWNGRYFFSSRALSRQG